MVPTYNHSYVSKSPFIQFLAYLFVRVNYITCMFFRISILAESRNLLLLYLWLAARAHLSLVEYVVAQQFGLQACNTHLPYTERVHQAECQVCFPGTKILETEWILKNCNSEQLYQAELSEIQGKKILNTNTLIEFIELQEI